MELRPSARALVRLGLLLLGAGLAAGLWELLAAQMPGSPLHAGVLPGPIEKLREVSIALGLGSIAAAWLLSKAALDREPRRLVVAVHVGALVVLATLVYGAATGMVGVQLIDPRIDAQVMVAVRLAGYTVLSGCLAALATKLLRPRRRETAMVGKVVGLYVRPGKREPVRAVADVAAVAGRGLTGDHKNGGDRQVTLISREAWDAVCAELGTTVDPGLRRANVVVEGIPLGSTIGRRIRIDGVLVEVLGETRPCERMDEAHKGLKAALEPDCRAGVFGRIEEGGTIAVGSRIEVIEG